MRRALVVVAFACGGAPAVTTPPATQAPAPAGELAPLVAEARALADDSPAPPVTVTSGHTRAAVVPRPAIAVLARGLCPGKPIGAYGDCRPLRGTPELVDQAWLLLGNEHFLANQPREAIGALANVSSSSPDHTRALYLIAWSHYRSDELPQAIEVFDQLVRASLLDRTLREEALQYIAICFTDPWKPDELPSTRGLERAVKYYRGRDEPHLIEVFEKLGDTFLEMRETATAAEAYHYAIDHWPNDPHAPSIVKKLAALGKP